MCAQKSEYLSNESFAIPQYLQDWEQTRPYREIGSEIMRLRCEGGLTQQQVAEQLGTTASVISSLERFDYGQITLNTLGCLAKTLGSKLSLG